jgi:thioredoxin reductase
MGVEFRTEHALGTHFTLDELTSQGYEAIFLAIGAPEAKKLTIEGIELEGVLWGLDFLKEVNVGHESQLKNRVLVIGGGNVAMDVALTALRVGAKSVKVACLEPREEMPAHDWEIQEALDENIELNCSWGPKRILGKNGKVTEVELISCTSVFDDKGNFNPTFDETGKKSIETDIVILAIGQNTDLSVLGTENQIEISLGGFIKIKDNFETTKPGVFAGGEVTKGPLSVAEAIEMGREIARSIDKYLGGTGEIDEILADQDTPSPWLGRNEDFFDKQRVFIPSLPIIDRIKGFDEINLGYNEEMAVEEATRCLRCDLRLHISPVILPPERWLELTKENIQTIPETEGALQVLDENKHIIYIQGTANLREALDVQIMNNPKARYFGYEEDPMYTKKESELLQQFMQEFGRMPEGNEDLDDDLF